MSNPIEAVWKLLDSLDYQVSLGGWHKTAVVFICGLVIYAVAISVMYFEGSGHDEGGR